MEGEQRRGRPRRGWEETMRDAFGSMEMAVDVRWTEDDIVRPSERPCSDETTLGSDRNAESQRVSLLGSIRRNTWLVTG